MESVGSLQYRFGWNMSGGSDGERAEKVQVLMQSGFLVGLGFLLPSQRALCCCFGPLAPVIIGSLAQLRLDVLSDSGVPSARQTGLASN